MVDWPYILEHRVFTSTAMTLLVIAIALWSIFGAVAFAAIMNSKVSWYCVIVYGILCGPIVWIYGIIFAIICAIFFPMFMFYEFIEGKLK